MLNILRKLGKWYIFETEIDKYINKFENIIAVVHFTFILTLTLNFQCFENQLRNFDWKSCIFDLDFYLQFEGCVWL